MSRKDVDISSQTSDAISDFKASEFDAVVTCCGCGDKLNGELTLWKSAALFEDWNLDDPPAIDPGDLSAYERVRDECKKRVVKLLNFLEEEE